MSAVLHDRAFRITHGRGMDVDAFTLIRDLDAALTAAERIVEMAEAVIDPNHPGPKQEDRLRMLEAMLRDYHDGYANAREGRPT